MSLQGPGQSEFPECGVLPGGAVQSIFDPDDDGMGRLALTLPLDVGAIDQGRQRCGADGFEHQHEGAAVQERADEFPAFTAVGQQVLREVVPAEDLLGLPGEGGHGQAVFGVVEHCLAQRTPAVSRRVPRIRWRRW